MHPTCRIAGILTRAQLEVLKSLVDLARRKGSGEFWAPRELGAYRSSSHGGTLKRLHELGYAERHDSAGATPGGRARFRYRLSTKGQCVWAEMRELLDVPVAQIFGGAPDQSRLTVGQRLVGRPG